MNLREFKESRFSSSPHLLLIGNPVSHSLSPVMHNIAAKHHGLSIRYYAVQVDEKDLHFLPAYLSRDDLIGMNVTIPHKRRMLRYMDEAAASCREIGAVNTVVKQDEKLEGYNTDVSGFSQPLRYFQTSLKHQRAVVFGTGGAARAVVFGLKDLKMDEIVVVSRNPDSKLVDWPADTPIVSYDQWQRYAREAALLVNTTPLGMQPNIEESPVKESEKHLLTGKICYDIVYTPLKTTFLRQAEEAGATTISGLDMFIQQGNRAFELWTGKTFPVERVREKLLEVLTNEH